MARGRRMRKSVPASKLKKTVVELVKQVSRSTQETKTTNCPDALAPAGNTINRPYASASGLAYLVNDVFSQGQGITDGTAVGSRNRIGDEIYGLSMRMNYYFSLPGAYGSPTAQTIPYVKLRVIVYEAKSSQAGLPTASLLLDTNYVGSGPFTDSTLQPILWDDGYINKVYYDKVKILRPSSAPYNQGAGIVSYPYSNVYHLDKVIKINKKIRFNDNSSTPNATRTPIHVVVMAEIDNATSFTASGQRILFMTGYTSCTYKDA